MNRRKKEAKELKMEHSREIGSSKREYERQLADEDDEQLRSFQAAVATRFAIVHEPKEAAQPPLAPTTMEQKPTGKRNMSARPFNTIIKVKSQPKKAKASEEEKKEIQMEQTSLDSSKANLTGKTPQGLGLVSYSDVSEDDG